MKDIHELHAVAGRSARATQSHSMLSVWEGLAGFCDSDPVIGVLVVHVGHFILRHMTGDAILFGYRACRAGFLGGRFTLIRRCVATETSAVIGSSLTHQRLMRIVAAHAGQARVALAPATAAL